MELFFFGKVWVGSSTTAYGGERGWGQYMYIAYGATRFLPGHTQVDSYKRDTYNEIITMSC